MPDCSIPGFRCLFEDDAGNRAVAVARQRYNDELTSAWKHPVGTRVVVPDVETEFSSHGAHPAAEGSPCTKDGWPGVLRRGVDRNLYCDISAKTNAWSDARRSRKTKYDPRGGLESPEEIDKESDDDDDDDGGEIIARATSDQRRRRPHVEEPNEDDEDGEQCEGSAEAIVRNASTHHESDCPPRPHADTRSISQLMRDHQNKMADIYDKLDHELSEKWRRS